MRSLKNIKKKLDKQVKVWQCFGRSDSSSETTHHEIRSQNRFSNRVLSLVPNRDKLVWEPRENAVEQN